MRKLLLLTALLGLFPLSASAEEESGYDRVWAHARVYQGENDSFFQWIDLSGRLQLDLAYVENRSDSDSEFNVRRFRFGFKSKFKQNFILHIEGEFDPQDSGQFYQRLTDTYIAWELNDLATLTAGKHSAGFTLDGMTSSKRLLTIDRSNLTNNIWFTEEYIPGISVKGGRSGWNYFLGLFSSGDDDPEFGDFKGGEFVLGTLGRNFKQQLGADDALLRLNLVYNEPDPENGFTNLLEKIVSLNFQYEKNGVGVRSDISAGAGYYGQSDLWGFYVMPYLRFSDSMELVARYTYIDSEDENGIRFARYERNIAEGQGDRYNEIYLGFNYYWYGHKLKLQNGLQFVDMQDRANDGGAYAGWAWTTGFRVSW
jgi:phosphate-selective porin OprO/OprP